MASLHEVLPPEFWDEFFKPRGPMGLISGRTALGFIPGVSQGLDVVDAQQMMREGDNLGLGLMAGGYLLGPASQVLRKGGGAARELIAGPRSTGYDRTKGTKALVDYAVSGKKKGTVAQKLASQQANEGYFTLPDATEMARKYRVPVYEFSDAGYNLTGYFPKIGETTTLDKVITHDELFKQYPEFRNYKIEFSDTVPASVGGFIDTAKKKITVNSDLGDPRRVILHEIQHGIAAKENLSPGFVRWDYWRTKALQSGLNEDQATTLWHRMHAMDFGENIAELPAAKWDRINRRANKAAKKHVEELDQQLFEDPRAEWDPGYKADVAKRDEEWQKVYDNIFKRIEKEFPVSNRISTPNKAYPEMRDFEEAGKSFTYGDEELLYDTFRNELTSPQSYDDLAKEVLDRPGEREAVYKVHQQILEELRNAKD